jgi:hypothetical protein
VTCSFCSLCCQAWVITNNCTAPAGAGTVHCTCLNCHSKAVLLLPCVQGLTTHVIDVKPQPLTAELLARAPELAGEAGQQLLQLFRKQGVIDAAGLLVDDPRQATWHAVVQQSGIPGERVVCPCHPGRLARLCFAQAPCLSVSQCWARCLPSSGVTQCSWEKGQIHSAAHKLSRVMLLLPLLLLLTALDLPYALQV